MQNTIWIACIFATLVLFIARPKWGGLAYLIAALLAPYGIFRGGDLSIRPDLVLAPTMLACQLLGFSRTAPKLSLIPITWLFVVWLLWIGISTVVTGEEFDLVNAFGYIRFVLVMIVFSWIPWHERDAIDFSFVYVLTAIPVALLSVGQVLGVPLARALTEACYSPPGATVIERQAEAELSGYLYRAVGVFGNVSPAATFFLLVCCLTISLFSSQIHRSRRFALVFVLGAAGVGGLATASATFVGGISLALLTALATADPIHRRKLIVVSVGCLAALALCVLFVKSNFGIAGETLEYQLHRLRSWDLLSTRYSSDTGILADAIEILSEHPFVGMGWTPNDVFTSDSIYFAILFSSGIIGIVPLVAGQYCLLCAAYRTREVRRWATSWTAVMLLGGIGCTTLLTGRLADGWWAVQGILIARYSAAAAKPSVFHVSSRPAAGQNGRPMLVQPRRLPTPRFEDSSRSREVGRKRSSGRSSAA